MNHMEEAESIIERLNLLVEEIENYPDAQVRENTLDIIQIVLSLHGEVLRRVLETLEQFPQREQVLPRLLADEVIRSVLIIHNLMPEDLRTRVAGAVEAMRPFLLAQGCDIKFLGIEDGSARLRLIRKGDNAPPISVLQAEIENALTEAAPDLGGVIVDGAAEQIESTEKAAEFLGSLISKQNGAPPAPKPVQIKGIPLKKPEDTKWIAVIRALGFDEGQIEFINYADINILICKSGGDFHAFRNVCPASGKAFESAEFKNPMLVCLCHELHFDVRHKGICETDPRLKLESLPVKIEDEKVKVAL